MIRIGAVVLVVAAAAAPRGRSETVFHPTGRESIVSAVDVRSEPVLGCPGS